MAVKFLERGQSGTANVNAALNEAVAEAVAEAAAAPVVLDVFEVATLPAEPVAGQLVVVTDGGNEGAPVLAVFDGDDWLPVALGPALDLGEE